MAPRCQERQLSGAMGYDVVGRGVISRGRAGHRAKQSSPVPRAVQWLHGVLHRVIDIDAVRNRVAEPAASTEALELTIQAPSWCAPPEVGDAGARAELPPIHHWPPNRSGNSGSDNGEIGQLDITPDPFTATADGVP